MIELFTSQWKLNYNAKTHRLRCHGHILNLACQSFLFKTDNESITEIEDDGTRKYNTTKADITKWRKYGPLGKLHNIVVFIQGSVQREQQFWELSNGLRLARDNSTRWNSWYTMLATALNLQDAIDKFCKRFTEKEMEQDILNANDWLVIRDIKFFLEKIKESTKAMESPDSGLELTLPNMEYILNLFETNKTLNANHPVMGPMLNSGWLKFEKYYKLTDESPAYAAAVLLNPRFKWHWLEKHWQANWLKKAKAGVKKLWEDEYKPADIPLTSTEPPQTTNSFLREFYGDDDDEFALLDEYKAYCESPRVNIREPIKWWLEATQQKLYPNLSKMALDILSIPAMSTEPERLFSGAKISLTDRRNRMGDELLQALECLKSWHKITDREYELMESLYDSLEHGILQHQGADEWEKEYMGGNGGSGDVGAY